MLIPEGEILGGVSGYQGYGGDSDIKVNGNLYRRTQNGVFRVQNGQLFQITAEERNMFVAIDNGTYKPQSNIAQINTPNVNNNQSKASDSYLIIGGILFLFLLMKGR